MLIVLAGLGCKSLPKPVPYTPTKKGVAAATAAADDKRNNRAPQPIPPEEEKNRVAYIAIVQSQYNTLVDRVDKVAAKQLRQANNNRNFVLGTGAVGISCGIAVATLAAASPANLVWITAISGVGSGALVFQTKAALEGISVEAVAATRQAYLSNVISAEIVVNAAMVKMASSVTATDLAVWQSAATEAANSITMLRNAVIEPIVVVQKAPAATNAPTGAAPSFSTQPSNVTAKAGSAAEFTAIAQGASVEYQWQVSSDGVDWKKCDGTPYNDTTKSKLSITNVTGLHAKLFRCVATDAATKASSTSTLAVLTVN